MDKVERNLLRQFCSSALDKIKDLNKTSSWNWRSCSTNIAQSSMFNWTKCIAAMTTKELTTNDTTAITMQRRRRRCRHRNNRHNYKRSKHKRLTKDCHSSSQRPNSSVKKIHHWMNKKQRSNSLGKQLMFSLTFSHLVDSVVWQKGGWKPQPHHSKQGHGTSKLGLLHCQKWQSGPSSQLKSSCSSNVGKVPYAFVYASPARRKFSIEKCSEYWGVFMHGILFFNWGIVKWAWEKSHLVAWSFFLHRMVSPYAIDKTSESVWHNNSHDEELEKAIPLGGNKKKMIKK